MEENNIYNMDCIEGMKHIEDETIDMILSDLPYGVTKCIWDKKLPLDDWWSECNRIIKPNGSIVLSASQPFTTDLINSNRKYFRYCLVWIKNKSTGFLNAKKMPLKIHEDICIFGKGKITYNPQIEDGFIRKVCKEHKSKSKIVRIYNEVARTDYNSTKRYPISALFFNKDCTNTIHPTQKPVALFEYLIRTYSNEEDLVLDCCIGSGTTAIACINSNRRYIGFETDKDFYTKAVERIKKHQIIS